MPHTDTPYRLVIEGRLAGMNEFIAANRRNPYAGAKLKKSEQFRCEKAIRRCLGNVHIDNPVFIEYSFYEKDKRRDLDNISGFAHKVIQDALVGTKILTNDGWGQIIGYSDEFYVDSGRPRIEILIKERQRHGRTQDVRKNDN